jgi:hypothetical protein
VSVPARVGATADATIYKNKDDGIKKYMFATTPESQAGIPFKFSLDMIADLAFEHQKTRDDPATLELLELGANEGGNPVEYTSFKLPPGLKNRDFCVMRSDRSSEGLYEAVQRSTEHPVRKLKRPFARQLYSILKRSFYQDRLGTNIGENVEGEDSVVAFSACIHDTGQADRVLDRGQGQQPQRCEKRHSFFEFSLCLSRACLGKIIVSVYKWLKMAVFRRQEAQLHPCVPVRLHADGVAGRRRVGSGLFLSAFPAMFAPSLSW